MNLWRSIQAILEGGQPCVRVSVTETAGSAPREAGTHMIVRTDGAILGTIGGGHLEFQALQIAREYLKIASSRMETRRFSLGPDLGQCCGGRADLCFEVLLPEQAGACATLAERESTGGAFWLETSIVDGKPVERRILEQGDGNAQRPMVGEASRQWLIERFGSSPRDLYLFGAGHVGRAIVLALAALPFNVTWIDSRADAFPGVGPANCRHILSQDPAAELAGAPRDAFVLVMTHNHALDEDIVAKALVQQSFPYVGMIGSQTKRKRFESRLKARGVPAAALAHLVSPIGGGRIKSKLPAAIAASVAVEILEYDEELRADVKLGNPGVAHAATFGR